ncbi:hypothetical protein HMPREF3086_04795 [Dietzia sp. HMSC21D01]|uniref:DUF6230 family protein n=2 Tax=Dietzia TaxID=37914 RepID=A0AAW5Q8G8_9ACTN|nr:MULTISPECIES: DUF6230 family protein [Dietzia]PWD95604.1 hypothetical protein DEQ16_09675 [Dietzia maris]MBM7231965.1 hypothetical protein [Dietzia cinnamea]MCT1865455.1 DUF6230 family protein [Dietzia cinnamea]MCT2028855.1 DUF6230 family protein [Dietzia cinnamea]MCT2077467.1 DUF6230 family protein [Dietzia cinnamea]
MGHIRYGRFAALSAAGLLVASAGAVVTAQTGLNISAGELVASAQVRGLNAGHTSIQAGHGILDAAEDPVAMVIMEDVRMNYVCARMKSVNVPFLGTVTMTAVLPEDADITADKLTIDSALLSGPMALDEMIIGAGAAEPTPRSGSAAVGLSSGSLTAGHLDVELAGLHATRLTSSTIELRAERGEASC